MLNSKIQVQAVKLVSNLIFIKIVIRTEIVTVNHKMFALSCYDNIYAKQIQSKSRRKILHKYSCQFFVKPRLFVEVLVLVYLES